MSPAEQQRKALIRAGRSLALRYTFYDIDPVRICSEAHLPPESFEQHFQDMTEYLLALQQNFLDEMRDKIFKGTTGMKAGINRIKLASEIYLEGCLAGRALRAWLQEARAHPDIAEGLRRQSRPYRMVVASELKTLGWPHPEAAANIFVAMTNETVLAEHRIGQALPELREALWDFLERCHPKKSASRERSAG